MIRQTSPQTLQTKNKGNKLNENEPNTTAPVCVWACVCVCVYVCVYTESESRVWNDLRDVSVFRLSKRNKNSAFGVLAERIYEVFYGKILMK